MNDIFDILEGKPPEPVVVQTEDWLKAEGNILPLLELANPLERIARASYSMPSMFDDGGMRTALLCELLGLTPTPGKLGNDAQDKLGRFYELKSVTRKSGGKIPGVSAGSRIGVGTIERYRQVYSWIIGVFDGITPIYVWQLKPETLEPLFSQWEAELQQGKSINNPKIPMDLVETHGKRILDLPQSMQYPRP